MAIEHFDAQSLRDYIRSHHENSYVLMDVRQPEEYSHGHIPGARLVPLPQLIRSIDDLPADKELVFYCHSGGRSMSAAVMAEEMGVKGPIYNLNGGMLAWDGGRVADFPKVNLFVDQTSAEMFKTAMNLEKGAQIFYETVGRDNAQHEWAQIFERLSTAEIAHARMVYDQLQNVQPQPDTFESMYGVLSGEVLEGGLTLDEAMQQLSSQGAKPCLRLVELAMQIEYAAYDLYRTLSDQIDDPQGHKTFIRLAQAEKGHMQSLIEAIGKCDA